MAKAWKSTTTIQYGKEDGTLVVFKPGDTVMGLSKVQMAQLWEAGALEATTVDTSPVGAEEASDTANEGDSGTTNA